MKKFGLLIPLSAALVFSATNAEANSEGTVEYGGSHEEETGFYTNDVASNDGAELLSGPTSHSVDLGQRTNSSGVHQIRSEATTTWSSRHYTEAYMENDITGNRVGANRVWGSGTTTAYSDWMTGGASGSLTHSASASFGQ